jgi:CubicO group peptidase (beta-lactamase class C family)
MARSRDRAHAEGALMMRRVLIAVVLYANVVSASPETRAIDHLLARYTEYGFSGVLLVSQHGKVVLHKAYGPADREHNIANTLATRFPIASITKTFTAAAILRLHDEGRLALSDPLSKFFSGLSAEKGAITIEQLLVHTSGLPADREGALDEALRTIKLESPPGAAYNYSNLGYDVLARIVEIVSGQSFRDFVMQRLVQPAGLKRTSFEREAMANGYAGPADNPQKTTLPPYEQLLGSGSVISDARDLLRWAKALYDGKVLKAESTSRMFRGSDDTVYGWDRAKTREGREYLHSGGDWDGYKSDVYLFPNDNAAIVLLANIRPSAFRWNPTVIRNVMRLLFATGKPVEPPPVRRVSADVAGTFGGFVIRALPHGNGISVSAFDQKAIDVLAFADGAEPEEIARVSAMTGDILDALQHGDVTSFAESRSVSDGLATFWKERVMRDRGSFSRATPLGVAPKGPSRWETYVRLEYERGEPQMLRIVTRRGTLKLVAAGLGGDAPYTAMFLPQSSTRFASFDVTSDEITALDVNGDEIVVKHGSGTMRARRAASSAP